MAKSLPKELFVWRENEGDGDNEYIACAETLEEACYINPDDKRKIGHFTLTDEQTYTLKVTRVIKKVRGK